MKINFLSAMLLGIVIIGSASCVSQKKYLGEFSDKQECLEREKALKTEVQVLKEQMEAYNTRIAYKDGQLQSLSKEAARLDRRNQDLQAELNRIINDATSAQEQMEMALYAKAQDLNEKERVISELQEAIYQRDQALRSVLSQVEGALGQYTADELSIEMRDGKVYVALSDRMLFQSGSVSLDNRGKEALGKLANVLQLNPELSIVVEGHTDAVPIKTDCVKDNWDLSVLRATSVVRLLTGQYGLVPARVTAAGRGEFQPKATNETREGRALNRRTEIIIQPRLDQIFGVIQSQSDALKN